MGGVLGEPMEHKMAYSEYLKHGKPERLEVKRVCVDRVVSCSDRKE